MGILGPWLQKYGINRTSRRLSLDSGSLDGWVPGSWVCGAPTATRGLDFYPIITRQKVEGSINTRYSRGFRFQSRPDVARTLKSTRNIAFSRFWWDLGGAKAHDSGAFWDCPGTLQPRNCKKSSQECKLR